MLNVKTTKRITTLLVCLPKAPSAQQMFAQISSHGISRPNDNENGNRGKLIGIKPREIKTNIE